MKKTKVLFLLVLACFSTVLVNGQQTSAGKSFYVDYAQWCTLGYPGIYINCGNNAAFNTGNQLTMEVWLRAYTFGENRKVMGKMSDQLNSGYVLGFENLNPYSQILNPDNQEVPRTGTGSIPVDSAWVHFATTFSSNGKMINYINGVNVGEITIFPQSPIASNDRPFVIGLAPWDLYSYEFTGNIDEVRIWNTEKSEVEIKRDMFHQLTGNEANLVAYYNFNTDVDSVVHDRGVNAIDGVLKNVTSTAFSWATSYAPVGDSIMAKKADIQASWYGKNPDQYTYAISTNGLSMITSIGHKEFWKYMLFGHNSGTGKTSTNAPATAPVDFERLSREWYVNKGGNFTSQVVFNLTDGAAGGATLPTGPDSLYTLLVRDDTTQNFTAYVAATTVMGSTVLFNNVNLENKYYTLGYSSQRLAPTASVREEEMPATKIYPNPASNILNISLLKSADVKLIDIAGRVVYEQKAATGSHTIQLNELSKGLYFVQLTYQNNIETQKIIIK